MTDSTSSIIQIPFTYYWKLENNLCNTAVLQDGDFSIPGNLVIESGAALHLVRATLSLESNAFYISEGGEPSGIQGRLLVELVVTDLNIHWHTAVTSL